jgi:hypothetical protein
MTYTPRAQRLMMLARRAGNLEYDAYMAFNRPRAYYFMRKMNALTKLAIEAQHGGSV